MRGDVADKEASTSSSRNAPRVRTSAPKARCAHEFPILVLADDKSHYYGRCLGCLEVGPKRPTPEAARKALCVLGARVVDGL